jgi:D-alanine-D-alanine ligase
MRIAIVHDDVGPRDAPDALDVLDQARAVQDAVTALGHKAEHFPCTLDLAGVMDRLTAWKTDLVFNLVESLGGKGRLIHLPAFCLDAMDIPFTGAGAEAMYLTSHKVMAKKWMAAAGIPTPAWVGPYPQAVGRVTMSGKTSDTWIIKSVWEHASIGLDEESLVEGATPEMVFSLLAARASQLGGSCFAERFIDGREFNLTLLAGPGEVQVMPPAEIVFEGYGTDMPRIVDYAAKWEKDSFAYQHTVRRFDFPPEDQPLLAALAVLAGRCWEAFGLGGYARVDFRVDADDRPWVLEVNANPSLSRDAGYAAALARAGLPFTEAVRRIIEDVQGVSLELNRDCVSEKESHARLFDSGG